MRSRKATTRIAPLRAPKRDATYEELNRFFDRHDSVELIERRIIEIDPDRDDIERMLSEYWKQPNTKQLNIRIPAAARRMIEKLARRKTVEVSTLVRTWVIEGMRRDAAQP